MNVQNAALKMLTHIKKYEAIKMFNATAVEHAKWLLHGVAYEYMVGDTAIYNLAWGQCILRNYGILTIDEIKQINKDS